MSNYKVQSILFDKSVWNLEEAINWIFLNGYTIKKVDETKSLYRCRQLNPAYLKKKGFTNYYNKKIGKGIQLVLAYKEPTQEAII